MALSATKVAERASLIDTVLGVAFYEHPTFGDEVGLIAVYRGRAVQTDCYDVPAAEDMEDGAAAFVDCYA